MKRRQVLVGGAAAAGLVVMAGCGRGGTTATKDPSGSGASGLVEVAEVPVGGAVSATDREGRPLIVAQPKSGTVVAFSAICTHQGCTVAPDGKELLCPCHGSVYAVDTGDNVSGPAPSPLAKVSVKVVGGRVVEA